MEIRQLEYFHEIAATGSIHEAARRLNMSQPPLSYQIKQLEAELNVKLFERTRAGVTLTEAGKLLYDRTENILNYVRSTELEVSKAGKKQVLRIGITPTTVTTIMPYISRFSRENSDVNFEVRDAIVNHTGEHMAATLEGVLIKYADRIAYINHDIDDACRAGLLDPGDIPADICRVLGDSHSSRINTMVSSVVRASMDRDSISMEPEVQEATVQLREFLFEQVYLNPRAKGQESKAQELVKTLFGYYATHPDRMPELYRRLAAEGEPVERCVCDFISGMTDRYAIETYEELFVPRVWRGLHE